ncbi:MAG: hypothetical protein B7Z38_05065 [Rhodobacterales bacterium 12-64-8]|nr:MAG: hypothetical protein B7Z38_05065 [Rhodobacterales bacterium 12-64-8]
MRGEVLRYDDNTGLGLISGDDGIRYQLRRSDLQQLQPVRSKMRVDFVPSNGFATDVFLLDTGSARTPAASTSADGAFSHAYADRTWPASATEERSLWGYFKKCMAKSFDGEGRARRKEYWGFYLFAVIFTIVTLSIASLIVFPAMISVLIRRLHDIGLSGWMILIGLIPFVGGLFLFVCTLIETQPRANKHGPVSKAM